MNIKLLFSAVLLYSANLVAQNDYATIKIFRPSKFVGSIVNAKISINGTDVCDIKNGGVLEYHLFNTGNLILSVKMSNNPNMKTYDYKLTVDIDNVYLFKLVPKWQRFELETIGKPIEKKLKTDRKITLSDIDFKQNQVERKK